MAEKNLKFLLHHAKPQLESLENKGVLGPLERALETAVMFGYKGKKRGMRWL